LHIDRTRSQPIYRQIADQIRIQIGEGRLPLGAQLPTVRQLAESLGVTRVTVQNAYSELQSGGWIESTVGRGTFVSTAGHNSELLSVVEKGITADKVMGNLHHINKIAGMRSFAYGEPDPLLFPTEDFWASFNAQSGSLSELMQYGAPQGDDVLRVELAAMLNDWHIDAMPHEIIVTSGVSQGLALATQCLAPAGSAVIVEQPTYLGMLHLLGASSVRAIGVPMTDDGMALDQLEMAIREHHPRFIYSVTNFQNPTGICASLSYREALLELSQRYDIPIVEDDTYGQLAYDLEPPPTLKALDRQGMVILLNGFSKILMPGLRMGYMVVPDRFREHMLSLRQALDLSGTMIIQRALANFLHRGRLKAHLRRVIPCYHERRDVMIQTLRAVMPSSVRWTLPTGGFSCWVTLPPDPRFNDFYHLALEYGVAVTPGHVFMAEPDAYVRFRLCFSNQPPEVIQEGVEILGELIAHDHPHIAMRGAVRGLPLV
jgi:DNA-binding transcriptional MocR family regulator